MVSVILILVSKIECYSADMSRIWSLMLNGQNIVSCMHHCCSLKILIQAGDQYHQPSDTK